MNILKLPFVLFLLNMPAMAFAEQSMKIASVDAVAGGCMQWLCSINSVVANGAEIIGLGPDSSLQCWQRLLIVGIAFLIVVGVVCIGFARFKVKTEKRDNERVRRLLRSLPDMIMTLDCSMNVVDIINPSESVLHEINSSDLIGVNINDMKIYGDHLWELVDELEQKVRMSLVDGRSYNGEFTIHHHSGVSHFLYRVLPYTEDQVICFMQNITRRVVREKELEESKARLELSVESSGYLPWSCDHITGIFTFSDKSGKELNMTFEDFLSRCHPTDRDKYSQHYGKILSGERLTSTISFRYFSQDTGTYEWVESCAAMFEKSNNGSVSKVIGLYKNISDQKKMTQELILLRDKAEESNKLKSAFLANMSHEIRTPLNAIVGFSHMIAEVNKPEEKAQYVNIIQANSDLLLQLINDILDVSKIESGRMDYTFTEFSLTDLMDDMEKIYQNRISTEVAFLKNVPAEGYIVRSDKNRLTQVVSNFISNAIKYTSTGEIRFGYAKSLDNVYIYVEDSGSGIPEDQHHNVFTRFSKFDKFVQGNGLGLSICKQIAEDLKLDVGFESQFGRGSKFWVKLPMDMIVEGGNVAEKDGDSVSESKDKVVNKVKVLVAEDNDSNYLLLSCVLKKHFHLLRAYDGLEALEMKEKENPHIIIMDVKMPNMDGLEATRAIRKSDKQIPIIALTANAFDSDRDRALEAGCNDFLTKPVSSGDLFKSMASLLQL